MAGLDAKQLEAAALVAEGRLTREDIARMVKVTERTVYRWLKDEAFAAEVDRVLGRYRRELMPKALRRLESIIVNGSDKDATFALQQAFKMAGWFDAKPEAPVATGPATVAYLPAKDPRWMEADEDAS